MYPFGSAGGDNRVQTMGCRQSGADKRVRTWSSSTLSIRQHQSWFVSQDPDFYGWVPESGV